MKPTSPLTHMCPRFPFLLKFTLLFPLVISAKVEDSHIICTSKKWHWFLPCPTKLVVSVGGSNLAFSVLPGMGRSFSFMLVYSACRRHLSKRESISSVVKVWCSFSSGACSADLSSGSLSSFIPSVISSLASLWTPGSAVSELSIAASSLSCVTSGVPSAESGDWDVETKFGSSTTMSSKNPSLGT